MTCCNSGGSSIPEQAAVTLVQTVFNSDSAPVFYRQERSGVDWDLESNRNIALLYVPAASSSIQVFVNGQIQTQGSHYSTNGKYLRFTNAIPSNSEIVVLYVASEAGSESVVGVGTGTILVWSGDVGEIPAGYLECNGAEVSKTTYAALYAVIEDDYGTPVSASNFVLPNLNSTFYDGTTLVTRHSIIKI